ncbi:MAG: 50S ribosomal protein L11 methyltransferase [Desulfobacteraceae bacterium]|nr:50S ribosomal protein L11 methyltransferase [Desulfobacteraceae bacterium]
MPKQGSKRTTGNLWNKDETYAAAFSPPCPDLYIYLMKGVLRERDEEFLGNAFIGNWVEGESSFLFFSRPSRECVKGLLNYRPDLELEDDYHFSYDEWQGGGLDVLEIDPFVIVPPWLKNQPDNNAIKILLDPGVVFGNCLHTTTRDCLRALSLVAGETELGRVLDLGTGTGVLAIAAALLGAKNVLAIDLNPLCVKTANKNVEFNHQQKVIRVIEGEAGDFVDEPVDLMVANIHHEVVKSLLEKSSFKKKTKLIISGLMRSQCREIKKQLERCGFKLLREWDHDTTWFTILAEVA